MANPTPATIPEALLATAARGRGEHVFHLEDGVERVGCAELAERAERAARRLLALGVEPGDAVGVLGPNRPDWMVWAFGVWIAGASLVPVQIPVRVRDPDAFREQLRRLVRVSGCRCVLAEPTMVGLLPAGTGVAWDEADSGRSADLPTPPAPADTAVIQFTSGSTAAPKGARISHEAVAAQMEILGRGYRYADGSPRSVLGWTPFFHDLGLFANLVQPAFTGSLTHHLPTQVFARDPASWLRLVEETGVSATVGPSSAFGSALRAVARRREQVELGSLEAAYFAAEGVDPEVARGMVEAARRFGFRRDALGATYGLAEAVMAVSFPPAGTGLRLDRISLPALTAEHRASPVTDGRSRLVVSTGKPHMDLRIVASDDRPLGERQVGEIQVRGRSLMSGYIGSEAADPFVGEWLRTGDLGYLAAGELYVVGRSKDMVISFGHNHYPEDFEWAAARVDGVRPGRCVAISPPGEERIVLVVESRKRDCSSLGGRVARAVRDSLGVAPSEVVVAPAGTIEKTTSGKLRRAAMREAYVGGDIAAMPR
jgi:fatty-acyl-CoA synthase